MPQAKTGSRRWSKATLILPSHIRTLWSAIYEHRLAEGEELTESDEGERAALTAIVEQEVRAALSDPDMPGTARFARSLIATVHGHCSYVISGDLRPARRARPGR